MTSKGDSGGPLVCNPSLKAVHGIVTGVSFGMDPAEVPLRFRVNDRSTVGAVNDGSVYEHFMAPTSDPKDLAWTRRNGPCRSPTLITSE
jgi:hypothetical protein